jgi:hypothetical protein
VGFALLLSCEFSPCFDQALDLLHLAHLKSIIYITNERVKREVVTMSEIYKTLIGGLADIIKDTAIEPEVRVDAARVLLSALRFTTPDWRYHA